ncbi:MAG: glycosyl hydrolase 2 galactose-binding domain-containing protein, partial [Acidimicrobiales bacterium]
MELPAGVDLSGTWKAAESDPELRLAFPPPDFDDAGWDDVAVPSHWRSNAAFAGSDGPLLYRRRFEAERPPEGTRTWLVLDGLFYQGDVWVDGDYLGDTEGYFVPHVFEMTEAAGARPEHVLGIEVACAPETDLTAKRNLTGVFQHWDCLDPDWNPGGIWRPVRLERTGPVRVGDLRLLCTAADAERAVVAVHAELDSDVARHVRV